ncbi:MAG TPA: bifunctional 5,10-methylenetetrahydrofolate dehydrogenase/5,10-methenyltetrahydrofolate cyclohydrolase [Candidatus Limnocylindrales bacterium]|nr:bifunctional 5,10-methylenetetrahydrofolate dehydrogenase/5,10-methenyltetrahydrofolate cyclohydrolase [Candidatus Limnocylindrales bacterium]
MTASVNSSRGSDRGAQLLLGAPLAATVRRRAKRIVLDVQRRYQLEPTLAVVKVGRQAASSVYVQQILRTCRLVGVKARVIELPRATTAEQLREQLDRLNREREVAGVIVQMPLPRHIPLSTVTDTILPAKDIDGIHPLNTGLMALGYEGFLPACAEAAVHILKDSGFNLVGKRAVVIGRSNVVGKPVQLLLMREHCTVTVCHRRTRSLEAEVARAEIVVTAAGHAGLVTGDMLAPGALVVDVGINVVPAGIVGDVDFESARRVAAAITPVPGGVGPLTNAILLEHLARAARWQMTSHPLTAGHGRKRRAA